MNRLVAVAEPSGPGCPPLGSATATETVTPEQLAQEVLAVRGVRHVGSPRPAGPTPREDRRAVELFASEVRVHLVVGYPEGFPLPRLIQRVKARLEPLAEGRQVSVIIEDVEEG